MSSLSARSLSRAPSRHSRQRAIARASDAAANLPRALRSIARRRSASSTDSLHLANAADLPLCINRPATRRSARCLRASSALLAVASASLADSFSAPRASLSARVASSSVSAAASFSVSAKTDSESARFLPSSSAVASFRSRKRSVSAPLSFNRFSAQSRSRSAPSSRALTNSRSALVVLSFDSRSRALASPASNAAARSSAIFRRRSFSSASLAHSALRFWHSSSSWSTAAPALSPSSSADVVCALLAASLRLRDSTSVANASDRASNVAACSEASSRPLRSVSSSFLASSKSSRIRSRSVETADSSASDAAARLHSVCNPYRASLSAASVDASVARESSSRAVSSAKATAERRSSLRD